MVVVTAGGSRVSQMGTPAPPWRSGVVVYLEKGWSPLTVDSGGNRCRRRPRRDREATRQRFSNSAPPEEGDQPTSENGGSRALCFWRQLARQGFQLVLPPCFRTTRLWPFSNNQILLDPFLFLLSVLATSTRSTLLSR